MAKLTVANIESGYLSSDKLNAMLAAIEAAFEKTLSRDGTAPNYMQADIDMNGYVVINSGASTNPTRLIRYDELITLLNSLSTGYIVQRIEKQVAASSQSVFTLLEINYQPGSNNLAVYVGGLRVFLTDYFTETDSTTVTMVTPMSGGEIIEFVTNDFIGSVEFSPDWSDITNKPSYATRDPSWTEVTSKPTTFAPSAHNHTGAEITSGLVADPRRRVWVQSAEPDSGDGLDIADEGALWAW